MSAIFGETTGSINNELYQPRLPADYWNSLSAEAQSGWDYSARDGDTVAHIA